MNRELLENVFVTALEGGSNYWYLITGMNRRKVRAAVPKETDPYFSTAILTAILDHGVEVGINDAENPSEELGVISAKTIEERLEKLKNDQAHAWALEAEEEGNGDANSSDIIFQYLVLGEVWFG